MPIGTELTGEGRGRSFSFRRRRADEQSEGATVAQVTRMSDPDSYDVSRRRRKRETDQDQSCSANPAEENLNKPASGVDDGLAESPVHVLNGVKSFSHSSTPAVPDRNKFAHQTKTSNSLSTPLGIEDGISRVEGNEDVLSVSTENERDSSSLKTRNDTSAVSHAEDGGGYGRSDTKSVSSNNLYESVRSVDRCKTFVQRSFQAMRKRFKKLCAIVALLVTAFTAVKTGNLIIQKASPPTKIFDPSSPIAEFEYGSLDLLRSRAFNNDVAFIMYYASWDADCIRFKEQYQVVANHFKKQVFFAAINCWWPEGECSRTLSIRRYPAFVATVRETADVEYRGPLLASYIIPFIDNLLNPVIPLHTEADFLHLKSKHDGVVVGHFDFNRLSDPRPYKQYFAAAVQSLNLDPWRRIQFAVITNVQVANKLDAGDHLSIMISSWNSTRYFSKAGWQAKSLVDWVYEAGFKEKGVLVEWITPSGIKSLSLSNVLKQGATLILFTPRSLVLDYSPYFEVLREVAMDYYNCGKLPNVNSLIHRSILRRHMMDEALMDLEEKCHEISNPSSATASTVTWSAAAALQGDTCCSSKQIKWRPSGRPAEKTCYCTACVHVMTAKCPGKCKKFNCLGTASKYLTDFDPSLVNSSALYCSDIRNSYEPEYMPYYRIITTCFGQRPNVEFGFDPEQQLHSGRFHKTIDENVEKMVHNFEHQYCRRLQFGLSHGDLNFPESSEFGSFTSQNWRSNFAGLGCSTNKTLKFIAIDSVVFPTFAESVGIDVFNQTHLTAAAIVEASDESVYLLNHEVAPTSASSPAINKPVIYEFIKNYTYGRLRRFLKSSTDTYSSAADCLRTDRDSKVICVPEVTSYNFADMVLNNRKNVLLMYYAPWCGFCTTVAHVFLSAAKYFEDVEEVVFARINGDKNDLPFHYSVDRYPTLILYPAWSKANSKRFPANEEITASKLVQFVVENSHPLIRWKVALKFCNRQCLASTLITYSRKLSKLRRQLRSLHKTVAMVQQEEKKKNLSDKQKKNYSTIARQVNSAILRVKNKIHLVSRFKEVLNKKLQGQPEVKGGRGGKILNNYASTDPMKKESVKRLKDIIKDEL